MYHLEFEVHGDPAPQGSKRYMGRGVMVESSKKAPAWRSDVRDEAQRELDLMDDPDPLWTGLLSVSITFMFARPKSHYGTGNNASVLKATAPASPGKPPDIDKLARAVLDAMTGTVFADDKTIVHLDVSKQYTNGLPGSKPGARICVVPMGVM